jgi:hypothetical protein
MNLLSLEMNKKNYQSGAWQRPVKRKKETSVG